MSEFNIACNIYRPVDYAKGIILILHGMSEHSQRYDNFARFLCQNGYVVVTYNHRGHGGGELGYFDEKDGWLKVVEDARYIMESIKNEYPPSVPFILFGHSMGSLVARSMLKRFDDEIDGVILSGPPNYNPLIPLALLLAKLICFFKGDKYRSKLLRQLSTGSFNKGIEKPTCDNDWLSYNADNVMEFEADPLCGFTFTSRGYYDLFWGMRDSCRSKRSKKTNKEISILLLSGEDDPCTGGTKGLNDTIHHLEKQGYTSIESIVYPDMRHEILNEHKHSLVYNDVYVWLLENSKEKEQ